MGNYQDDPVTRHHNQDWDRKVDARIRRIDAAIDRSHIDSQRSQLELDRLKRNRTEDDHQRQIDRFIRFTESAPAESLAREFARRRTGASIRIARDRRLSAETSEGVSAMIARLDIADDATAADIDALTREAATTRDRHTGDPADHQFVMALFDMVGDLWYLQTLANEWRHRRRSG